ncbi:methylated-DNA--[protein]-cysteine S-methyltransferase, partial [Proteus mirabilis]
GEIWSYKKLALTLGSVNYCRAVGMANSRNPISLIIPCHRVIGHNGKLVGYTGGLDIKRWLLHYEKVDIDE